MSKTDRKVSVEADPELPNVFVRYFTDYKFRWAINRRHPIIGRFITYTVISAPFFGLLWLQGASKDALLIQGGVSGAVIVGLMLYYLQVERPRELSNPPTDPDTDSTLVIERSTETNALQTASREAESKVREPSQLEQWAERHPAFTTVLGVALVVTALLSALVGGWLAFPPVNTVLIGLAGVSILFRAYRARVSHHRGDKAA